jgi:uncharacterized protein
MTDQELIEKVKEEVKEIFSIDTSGHDWWHIFRVWQNAKLINQTEKADSLVVELGALLHDLDDFKFSESGKPESTKSKALLQKYKVPPKIIDEVCHIVENVSFKGANVKNGMKSHEGMVVQDADRLDALGAIGIARCFAYGGFSGRAMYDPNEKQEQHQDFESYKNSRNSSIAHFYEKLLLLKDKLNTVAAQKLAEQRHQFMQDYLDQFFAEWQGKK